MPIDLSTHLVDSLILLTLTNQGFLERARPALGRLRFEPPVGTVLSVALNYFDRYKAPIGDHYQDEFIAMVPDLSDDRRELHVMYVRKLSEMDVPNVGYTLSKLDDYVRQQALEGALIEAADFAHDHEWLKAENVLTEALKVGVEGESLGHNYKYDFSDLEARNEYGGYEIRTGIEALDRLIGGFKRGYYVLLAGEYKGKKSWGLTNLGFGALKQGKRVLHISHENSKEETLLRYDRMFGWLTKEPKAHEITWEWKDENGVSHGNAKFCQSAFNTQHVAAIRRRLRRFRGSLIVRKFPMYSATMLDIKALLARLEAQDGFVPDVIINDYGDKMAPVDNRKTELAQKIETSMLHKRLADELNCIVINATQIDTESIKRGRVSKTSSYGNKSMLGDCDIMLGLIPQTNEQKETGETYMTVVGARGEKEGGTITFWKCLDAGQFCVHSIIGRVDEMKGGDDDVKDSD